MESDIGVEALGMEGGIGIVLNGSALGIKVQELGMEVLGINV